MRELSDFEEELVRRINEGKGDYLGNLLDPFVEGAKVTVYKNKGKSVIFLETLDIHSSDEQERIVSYSEYVSQIVINTVNLLKLLEEKGYIFTFNFADFQSSTYNIGHFVYGGNQISKNVNDQRVNDLLAFYCDKAIIPSEELKQFVKRNFITREEQRHRKILCATWIAIAISFTIGIASIIISISTSS